MNINVYTCVCLFVIEPADYGRLRLYPAGVVINTFVIYMDPWTVCMYVCADPTGREL